MLQFRVLLCVTFLFAATFARCADTDRISFSEQVYPILQMNCSGCHSPGEAWSGFSIGDYNSIRKRIIPGQPNNSLLFQMITGTAHGHARMPFNRTPLSDDQIALIKQWIEEGAETDNRKSPLVTTEVVLPAVRFKRQGPISILCRVPVKAVIKADVLDGNEIYYSAEEWFADPNEWWRAGVSMFGTDEKTEFDSTIKVTVVHEPNTDLTGMLFIATDLEDTQALGMTCSNSTFLPVPARPPGSGVFTFCLPSGGPTNVEIWPLAGKPPKATLSASFPFLPAGKNDYKWNLKTFEGEWAPAGSYVGVFRTPRSNNSKSTFVLSIVGRVGEVAGQ